MNLGLETTTSLTNLGRNVFDRNCSSLVIALNAIGLNCPIIASVVSKSFKHLSEYEAYHCLRFVLNACNLDTRIKFLDNKTWRDKNKYSKMDVENFKKDILSIAKDLISINKMDIPVLRKTDLQVPFCPKFFRCCTGLARLALATQLKLHGLEYTLPGNGLAEVLKKEILRFKKIQEETKIKFEEGIKLFGLRIKDLEIQLELLKSQRDQLFLMQKDAFSEFNVDPDDQTLTQNFLKELSETCDQLKAKNCQKLEFLNHLRDFLSTAQKLSNGEVVHSVLDGNDILKWIPYETRNFASKQGIPLHDGALFHLENLFRVVQLSFVLPEFKTDLSKITNIRLPPSVSGLLERHLNTQEILQKDITILRSKLTANLDREAVSTWFNNFYVQKVPIVFDHPSAEYFPEARQPVVKSDEKIARLVEIEKMRKSGQLDKLLDEAVANVRKAPAGPSVGFRRVSRATAELMIKTGRTTRNPKWRYGKSKSTFDSTKLSTFGEKSPDIIDLAGTSRRYGNLLQPELSSTFDSTKSSQGEKPSILTSPSCREALHDATFATDQLSPVTCSIPDSSISPVSFNSSKRRVSEGDISTLDEADFSLSQSLSLSLDGLDISVAYFESPEKETLEDTWDENCFSELRRDISLLSCEESVSDDDETM